MHNPGWATTIGRIVIFTPSKETRSKPIWEGSDSNLEKYMNGAESCPAIIVQVWNDTYVNLQVITPIGPMVAKTSVHTKETAAEGSDFWDWPEIMKYPSKVPSN